MVGGPSWKQVLRTRRCRCRECRIQAQAKARTWRANRPPWLQQWRVFRSPKKGTDKIGDIFLGRDDAWCWVTHSIVPGVSQLSEQIVVALHVCWAAHVCHGRSGATNLWSSQTDTTTYLCPGSLASGKCRNRAWNNHWLYHASVADQFSSFDNTQFLFFDKTQILYLDNTQINFFFLLVEEFRVGEVYVFRYFLIYFPLEAAVGTPLFPNIKFWPNWSFMLNLNN